MADQHEIPQLLVFDHAEHIGDVQREIDAGAQQMRAVAETSERRGECAMSARAEPVDDAPPGPSAMPRPVNEDEGFCAHFTRFQICVAAPPPPDGAALITCSSSPLVVSVRFCVSPTKFG